MQKIIFEMKIIVSNSQIKLNENAKDNLIEVMKKVKIVEDAQ